MEPADLMSPGRAPANPATAGSRYPGKRPSPASRLVLIGFVLLIACGVGAWRPTDIRSAGPGGEILIDLGDVVRVKGGAVGCRVTRRAGFPDQKLLDCRRAGRLPGSLGALIGHGKLLVVRFEQSGVANVVFTGKHEGESTTCHG